MSAMWTKELPRESGFYWYKDDGMAEWPWHLRVVEWDVEMRAIKFTGTELMTWADKLQYGGDTIAEDGGMFWNERLQAPPLP